MADQNNDHGGRRTIDVDLRQIVVWVLGALITVVGLLAVNAFTNLKDSVASASAKMEAAVKQLNDHSTQLATHELRIKFLESQQQASVIPAKSK